MDYSSAVPTAPPPVYSEVPQSAPHVTVTAGATNNQSVLPNFGPNSQIYVCPYCHHNITTRTRSKATTRTHLIALCLCFCLCWLCCCCPYCIDSCQAINHYCPNCDAFLGTYAS